MDDEIKLRNVAEKIVNESLNVKKGEHVHISTWGHTIDFAGFLAVECYKNGAVPLITVITDFLFENALKVASLETLKQTPQHELALAEKTDVLITISGPANPYVLSNVPDDKYKAYSSSGSKIGKVHKERKVRHAHVLWGKVTKERAKTYGFDYLAWKDAVIQSLLIDYEELSHQAETFLGQLKNSKEIRLLSESGTDFRFKIGKNSIFVETGVISERDVEMGRYKTVLPAGLIEFRPQEMSAAGTLYLTQPMFRMGGKIENVKIFVEKGHIVSIEAEKGDATLQATIQRLCTERPQLNSISIGLNPKMALESLFSELRLGVISVAFGGEPGSCQLSGMLFDAALYVDEKKVLENGKWMF